jgi:DNA-binding MarR family transcriptional regulator
MKREMKSVGVGDGAEGVEVSPDGAPASGLVEAPKAMPGPADESSGASSAEDGATTKEKRPNGSAPEFQKEDFPFYWIARIHALYQREMSQALKAVDCDIPTWRVLAIVHDKGVSSISEIATHAIAELSTITKVVYRMKAEGLVDTKTAPHDGRVTHVTMTEAGERALQRVKDATSGLFKRSFSGLSPNKIAVLNDRLKIILENLQR